MTKPEILSAIGLFFDISGSVFLFKFGLANRIDPNGHIYLILEGENEEEKELYKKYKFRERAGVAFLFIGFVFQFISLFI